MLMPHATDSTVARVFFSDYFLQHLTHLLTSFWIILSFRFDAADKEVDYDTAVKAVKGDKEK